jgi:hypothetical protein
VSLKQFHVLFISLSVVLCVWFALWAFGEYRTAGGAAYLAAALASFALSGALVIYEINFLRKCRKVGIS